MSLGTGLGGEARTDVSNSAGTVNFGVGKVGQAFSFTNEQWATWPGASVQFLEIPDPGGLDLKAQEFTIDLWAKRTGDGQNTIFRGEPDPFGSVLIQKAINDATNEGISYSIWWNGAGIIKAGVNLGGVRSTLENGVASVADEWVHIALTVDGSTLRLYVNGAEVDQDLDASGALEYGGGSVVIGGTAEFARDLRFPRGFHGLIDELDLFGRALSPSEIAGIHAAGSSGKCLATDNTAPEVDVGPDQTVIVGETVQLDGSGSSDPDGDPLTFDWQVTKPRSSAALLSDPTAVSPTFLADVAGAFTIQLIVSDRIADSDPDLVTVLAELDTDGDGIADIRDNCPSIANPDQADADADAIGDVCETPRERILLLIADVRDLVDWGVPDQGKGADVIAKALVAVAELEKTPSDNQAAVGNIEGAVGELEAAVQEGLYPAQGAELMDGFAAVARQLATAAIDDAIDRGGDYGKIAVAQMARAQGNALRASGTFKDAVNEYKDAVVNAEGA